MLLQTVLNTVTKSTIYVRSHTNNAVTHCIDHRRRKNRSTSKRCDENVNLFTETYSNITTLAETTLQQWECESTLAKTGR